MANEVEVSVGFTQNIGNYENIVTRVAWRGEALPDESHEEATERLFAGLEPVFVEKAREVYNSMSGEPRRKTQITPATR